MLGSFRAVPDSRGRLRSFRIKLPEYRQCVYYCSLWWPAGGNRVYPFVVDGFGGVPEGGIFSIVELNSGEYLSVLPLASPEAYAWLRGGTGGLAVTLGTHGAAAIHGDIPLLAWAKDKSPYAAASRVWNSGLAASGRAAQLRERKTYPEPFEYLGWCSWESYRTEIDEENMRAAVRGIEQSGLPIRYFLVDEGHADPQTLNPDKRKFPRGYRPLTNLRNSDKIRWFGLWWGFLGTAHGIEAPGNLGNLGNAMMTCANGTLLPRAKIDDAKAFYNQIIQNSLEGGFDFLKVDFMVDALPLYSGLVRTIPTLGGEPPNTSHATANPFAASALLMDVFQDLAARHMKGVLNCNWHNASCLFNSGNAAVGRCSEDYQAENLDRAKAHLYHAYASIPWLGQIAWGDHDMFHSSDKLAGRVMAVSKAVAGGPIYLSDQPDRFAKDVIVPLAYRDGRLLRPLAPASPVNEDIFYQPRSGRLYRVAAPLRNNAAVIVVYNLSGDIGPKERKLTTSILPEHYCQASCMIQPYHGEWEIPSGGLVVYDWHAETATRFEERHDVSLRGFDHRLLQIAPIYEGWSVIGRVDKYLPAAAVDHITYTQHEIRLTLIESGPLAIWCEHGIPSAPGITFDHVGAALYRANLTVGHGPTRLVVTSTGA